jgi:alpha-amylase
VTPPISLVFGVHLHQPVGNFDHVFEQHVRDAYLPFLTVVAEHGFLPLTLHVSGPLLEWLERNDAAYLDRVGRLAADGKVELLASGFDEPILAALPRGDRAEQVLRMREAIRRRFGVEANGLWLTERVWEPDLAADLARAGVRYALVDDRHFLVSGFSRERLHRPFWTEADGQRLALLAIDERLRYLTPFKPPADTVQYLRALREVGQPLAVLVDDGEKFGGWPGTHDWVFVRGWLRQFLDAMAPLVQGGEVRLLTPAQALEAVPSGGLAYLSSASYREMEAWALPADAGTRLTALEKEMGAERLAGPDGALIRGTHWRSFLIKYPEANRMHKKMLALSALCRERGDPPPARRAIGRAQCNDAYWHGVFGGLYLPHLRAAVWRQLALAERELRRGEPAAWEMRDLDGDGLEEVWVHASAFSALLGPARGASLEEFTRFESEINLADTLTRRREAYHEPPLSPADREPRALFVERVLPASLTREPYAAAEFAPLYSWAGARFRTDCASADGGVTVECRATAPRLDKRYRWSANGELVLSLAWEPADFPADALFTTELSLARHVDIRSTPEAEVWIYPITTSAKSERGLEETLQGQSVTLRWPVGLGHSAVHLPAG